MLVDIREEDLQFLQKLQHVMRTQDTCCQAEPRYWVIMDTEQLCNVVAEDADESYLTYRGNIVAKSLDEIKKLILGMKKDILEKEGYDELVITEVETPFRYLNVYMADEGYEEELRIDDAEDAAIFLNDTFENEDYDVIYTKKVQKPAKGPLFMTKAAAEEYLQKYGYNHSKDAHPYAMTAYRAPEIERLWKIVEETSWKQEETI